MNSENMDERISSVFNVDVENGSNVAVMFNGCEKTILANERGTNVAPNVDSNVDSNVDDKGRKVTGVNGGPTVTITARHVRRLAQAI